MPSNQHVYFIQNGDMIKIGISQNVLGRLAALQTANSTTLVLLGTIPNGGKSLESRLHSHFSHLRRRGEWFRAEPELVEYIEAALAPEEPEEPEPAPQVMAAPEGWRSYRQGPSGWISVPA